MEHDVFISHSSKNKPAADAICHVLEENGIRCWIAPRDIPPGSQFGEQITRGLRNCRVFLLVFSSEVNQSPAVQKEIERAALGYHKPIIPFCIEDVAMNDNIEFFASDIHRIDAFREKHWIDAYPNSVVFDELLKSVKALLEANDQETWSESVPGRNTETTRDDHPGRAADILKWALPSAVAVAAVAVMVSVLLLRTAEPTAQLAPQPPSPSILPASPSQPPSPSISPASPSPLHSPVPPHVSPGNQSAEASSPSELITDEIEEILPDEIEEPEPDELKELLLEGIDGGPTAEDYIDYWWYYEFGDFPGQLVGECFDRFFREPSWEFVNEYGEYMVRFTGKCLFDGSPMDVRFDFDFMGNQLEGAGFWFYKNGELGYMHATEPNGMLDHRLLQSVFWGTDIAPWGKYE